MRLPSIPVHTYVGCTEVTQPKQYLAQYFAITGPSKRSRNLSVNFSYPIFWAFPFFVENTIAVPPRRVRVSAAMISIVGGRLPLLPFYISIEGEVGIVEGGGEGRNNT